MKQWVLPIPKSTLYDTYKLCRSWNSRSGLIVISLEEKTQSTYETMIYRVPRYTCSKSELHSNALKSLEILLQVKPNKLWTGWVNRYLVHNITLLTSNTEKPFRTQSISFGLTWQFIAWLKDNWQCQLINDLLFQLLPFKQLLLIAWVSPYELIAYI